MKARITAGGYDRLFYYTVEEILEMNPDYTREEAEEIVRGIETLNKREQRLWQKVRKHERV